MNSNKTIEKTRNELPLFLIIIGGLLIFANGLRIVYYLALVAIQMFQQTPEKWMILIPILNSGYFFIFWGAVAAFSGFFLFSDKDIGAYDSKKIYYLKMAGLFILAYIISWTLYLIFAFLGASVNEFLLNLFVR